MSNKILLYTFEVDPLKYQFEKSELFIFKKIEKDLEKFKNKIIAKEPKFIVGFALCTKSKVEPIAINRFEKGHIIKDGKYDYHLFVPKKKFFRTSSRPTKYFCNWSAYHIAQFLEQEKLPTKLVFVHMVEEDLPKLVDMINYLKEVN